MLQEDVEAEIAFRGRTADSGLPLPEDGHPLFRSFQFCVCNGFHAEGDPLPMEHSRSSCLCRSSSSDPLVFTHSSLVSVWLFGFTSLHCQKSKSRSIGHQRERRRHFVSPEFGHHHGNSSNNCAAEQQIYGVEKRSFLITHTERLSEDSEERFWIMITNLKG